ncbi:MAG TPA: gamma carbonic anhydrase family protein [Acidimicrobiia bacterium]|nr:gamma carbonic anhydrase family protein [Acidimicrobiia bacterium]
MREPTIHPGAFVADSAHIHGHVVIGDGAVILFGVVIRAEFDEIRIGSETNIQDGTVIHCDAGAPVSIGDRVTVGHAAVIHGATVGDDCLVGIGSRALNGSVLGRAAWLGAGAILTEGSEIPPATLALGIPARPVRDLTADEMARQRRGVADYQRIAAIYRDRLTT